MDISYSAAGHRAFLKKPKEFPTGTRFFLNYEKTGYNIATKITTLATFADSVLNGYPFYPCVVSNKDGRYKTINANCFEYADIIAFDLEKGNHSEQRVKDELIGKGFVPCFFYRTYSHRVGENGDRNRIVYKLPYRITSPGVYLLLCVCFRALYWDIDTSCIDTARIFFGTNRKTAYIDEKAVLDLKAFVEAAKARIAVYRDTDEEKYNDILVRLTKAEINCDIGPDGLPKISFDENGLLTYEENMGARVARIKKEKELPPLTDDIVSKQTTFKKIPLTYWREKALTEPLYRELAEGRGHYGYKKATVLAASYRLIDADDVKADILNLLRVNASRFSDADHTIKEVLRIWDLPPEKGRGYGSLPLSYSQCDMMPQDTYKYPLTYLRNTKRTLKLNRELRVRDSFREVLEEHDFEKYPKSVIVNGGMGLGKTYSAFHDVKPILDTRYKKEHRVLILLSRKPAVEQANNKYFAFIDDDSSFKSSPDRITVMTYHKFMWMLEQGEIRKDQFNVIIADECQSLVKDSFARQMGSFLIWANEIYEGIVIWMSANGQFVRWSFEAIGYKNNFKMVFDKEGEGLNMRFDTDKIDFYSHSNIDYAIIPRLQLASPKNRVLVYLSSAAKCYMYYRKAKKKGYRAAFWVSEYCDTELKATEDMDEETAKYLDDNNLVAITLAEAFTLCESEREKNNIMSLKEALLKGENYPEDIDIIFTTSALRESINISEASNVSTVITDAFDEVEVLQQRGRIRGDIDTLIIAPQRQGTSNGLQKKIERFEELFGYSQQQLAEEYGAEIKLEQKQKGKTAYVLKTGNEARDEAVYRVNVPAYFGLKFMLNALDEVCPTTKKTQFYLDDVFGCLSSGGRVNIVYERELRRSFVVAEMRALLPKYRGLPLIGETAEKLQEECAQFMRDYDGDTDFSMKLILKEARDAGFEIKEGKIGKKHRAAGFDFPIGTKFRAIA